MRSLGESFMKYGRIVGFKPSLTLGVIVTLATFCLGQSQNGTWKPIFDGKSQIGWHVQGPGGWKVVPESLAFYGKNPGSEVYTHMVCDTLLTDYTLKLQFLGLRGNSGVYMHGREEAPYGMANLQVDLDVGDGNGTVSGFWDHTRQWAAKPKDVPALERAWKKKQWNNLVIEVKGLSYKAWVNDVLVGELNNETITPRNGRIGLQLHGGQNCEFYFRNFALLDTTAPTTLKFNDRRGMKQRTHSPFAYSLAESQSATRLLTLDGKRVQWKTHQMNYVDFGKTLIITQAKDRNSK
jgi:hypothetical protein